MDKILVEGGRQLKGQVRISGAKNAALPILVSSLLAEGSNTYSNVPDLKDVESIKLLLTNLGARADVSTTDEIGDLGNVFNKMTEQLVVLLEETKQKATLDREIEVAHSIQKGLIPPPDLIFQESIEIAAFLKPAARCGGDWWTAHPLADGRLLVIIGDVIVDIWRDTVLP